MCIQDIIYDGVDSVELRHRESEFSPNNGEPRSHLRRFTGKLRASEIGLIKARILASSKDMFLSGFNATVQFCWSPVVTVRDIHTLIFHPYDLSSNVKL